MTVQVQPLPVCTNIGNCFSVFIKKIWANISAVFDTYDRALHANRLYERMFRMSDTELADLGISRDELPQIFTRKMGWGK